MDENLKPRFETEGINLDNEERIKQIIDEYNKSNRLSKTSSNLLGILFLLGCFLMGVFFGYLIGDI